MATASSNPFADSNLADLLNSGPHPGPNPFTIGGLTLNSIDCPTELSIGTGQQRMTVTETVGGGKVTHVTGFQPDTNTFSGKLHEPDIEINVAAMRRFQVDGKERLVTWKGEQYYGIVRSFKPTYQLGGHTCLWQLAIEITRSANGGFSANVTQPSVDDAIGTLFETIDNATTTIMNVYGTVSGTTSLTPQQIAASNFNTSLTATSAAVDAATPTAAASSDAIASAQTAVAATQATVPPMLDAFPTQSAPYLAAEQASTALAVISANLSTTQTQSTAQVQGGSLFAIAATKYGDPSQAYAIMKANRLVSPILPGSSPTTLSFPPLAGVFNNGQSSQSTGFTR